MTGLTDWPERNLRRGGTERIPPSWHVIIVTHNGERTFHRLVRESFATKDEATRYGDEFVEDCRIAERLGGGYGTFESIVVVAY